MAIPNVFSGIVVSLALTLSPFPTGQVYGVDLLGAALGCMAVIFFLNIFTGPTAALVTGVFCGFAAMSFASSAAVEDRRFFESYSRWRRPGSVTLALALFAAFNALVPYGVRPLLVKNNIEQQTLGAYEKWNSYSRILALPPEVNFPNLWGASVKTPPQTRVSQAILNIDGAANTSMFKYDGSRDSVSFLKYDLVTLAYRLPNLRKSAVIGVGGGRDIVTAHYFGVPDITGVELNPIFINLHYHTPSIETSATLPASLISSFTSTTLAAGSPAHPKNSTSFR